MMKRVYQHLMKMSIEHSSIYYLLFRQKIVTLKQDMQMSLMVVCFTNNELKRVLPIKNNDNYSCNYLG